MLRSRVLLLLALAQLLGYGCDVSLEAESKIFACTSDDQCLTGFICKAIPGAENEDLSEVNACQRCTVKDVSVPQFQSHPACAQQSIKVTQNLDCALLPEQTLTSADVIISGQWTGAYETVISTANKQINFEPPSGTWKSGEIITVSNSARIQTETRNEFKPFVWQFRAPAKDGRAEFLQLDEEKDDVGEFQVATPGQKDAQLGDLDRDGDLDVVIATSVGSEYINVWLNGTKQPTSISLSKSNSLRSSHEVPNAQHICLADLNSDNFLDIFVVNDTAENEIWFNDGQGAFPEDRRLVLKKIATSEKHTNVAIGDLDGDGDADIVATDSAGSGNTWVWLQKSGQLVSTAQSLRDGLDVALGDVDNDGDLDALIATESKGVIIWINRGDGTFIDINKKIDVKNIINAIALGDLDSDGDLDAVLGKAGANQIWKNDGLANFSLSETQGSPLDDATTQEVVIADFDSNKTLDLFFANSDRSNSVWLNDGTAHFTRSPKLIGLENTPGAAIGDINNDDTLDVVLVQPDGNQILRNLRKVQVTGNFAIQKNTLLGNVIIQPKDSIQFSFNAAANPVHFVEDAAIDPLVLAVRGQWHGLYDVRASCVDPENCTTIEIKPPDDGYLAGETLTITATGKITSKDGLSALSPWTWQLTVDASKFDLAIDAAGQASTDNFVFEQKQDLFLNEPLDEAFVHGALGDLDNDTDLDIVVATSKGYVLIWENQVCSPPVSEGAEPTCGGTLQFTKFSQVLQESDYQENPETQAQGVALADFNNDRKLDIFVFFDGLDRIWWQVDPVAGSEERFAQGRPLSDATIDDSVDFEDIGASRTVDAILQDFNQDGLVDIYVANQKQSNTLWINQGDQTFLNTKQNFSSDGTLSVAAADLDLDGSLDVYVANEGSDNIWYNNRDSSFTSCNEARSTTLTTKVALGNFSQDDDPANINYGMTDIYLAQTATDSFITIDPESRRVRDEKILNNTGTIETPDAVLVELFDVDGAIPAEPNQALELVSVNENRLEFFRFKFASPEKIVGEYIFQKVYFLEDEFFGCVQKIVPGDLDQDQKMDFVLFSTPGCKAHSIVINKSP